MKPYTFNAAQEAWLVDLETTDAPQCRGKLWDITNGSKGYCCLGRAQKLLEPAADVMQPFYDDDQTSYGSGLSLDLMKRLKMYSLVGDPDLSRVESASALTELNDVNCLTFKQIAAVLRANPRAYFKD